MFVVTGATGHIGNTFVRELLRKGEAVRVLLHSKNTQSLDGLDVEKVTGDVRDFNSLVKAFKDSDFVFHMAGIVSILHGHRDLLHQVNVVGTRNVVNACLKLGIKRLIYTGSIHAILEPPLGIVIDETLPFDPYQALRDYGSSKARACLEVLKGVDKGLNAVMVFPTGLIGPYDFKPSRMGQFLIDFAKKKLIASIDGAYDFVDVRDVAIGHILACEKGRIGEGYILSGERITIKELMILLEEVTGVRAPRFKIPISLAKIVALFAPLYYNITGREPRLTRYAICTLMSNSIISNEKARCELGYSPRPIRQSIEDTIEYFKGNGKI
jgi:dihydroflavonol-4-reductase